MNTHLFIIDPQNDFCKQGETPVFDKHWRVTNPEKASGTLSIPGADKDMDRLATMIEANIRQISSITTTLDSHNDIHIAHPVFIVDSNGNHPNPFTLVTNDDIRSGKFRGSKPEFTKILDEYTAKLEATGKYKLCVWAPHCLIGTKGHAVVDSLNGAFREWCSTRAKNINFVTKGSNPFTEHYGAVQAEVTRDDDPTTKLNKSLINLLQNTGNDDILIAGEALSHCVATTIRQVAENFNPDQIKKFVLLEDACSNVTGFESFGKDFVTEMSAKGMRISNTKNYF